MNSYICTENDNEQRLDYILKNIYPELGTRTRKRLCETGQIYVNDRKAKAAYKLREGDVISVLSPLSDFFVDSEQNKTICACIQESESFIGLYKPAHFHSQSIAGKESASVESEIPLLFPDKNYQLLNRLDYGTSGLVMLAKNDEAKKIWHDKQEKHEIPKTYIALTQNILPHPKHIRYALELHKKYAVRVDTNSFGTRHTKVIPLAYSPLGFSLVACQIFQGARHQIRAHLASINCPLMGDIKYGSSLDLDLSILSSLTPISELNSECNYPSHKVEKRNHQSFEDENFLLHHFSIRIADFTAHIYPEYWGQIPQKTQTFLEKKLQIMTTCDN